jgi:hypothetical protein
MNNGLFKKLLPHLIAIVIFLVVSVIFCKPVFQGMVLQTHDNVGAQGMAHGAWEHNEKYGNLPLWNTNLFSGMPNYQVAVEGPGSFINFPKLLSLFIPEPASFFFLACISFYILSLAFGVNVYVGILGALSFAFATYNPVILNAGHYTKMMAVAFAPGLLAGIVLLFEKKYWIGIAVATLFAFLEITSNHPQINYYLFIVIAFMTIGYIIQWVRNGQLKHMAISLSLAFVSALIGVGTAAVTLFPTYEYARYTMRGGKSIENTGTGIVEKTTTGLDNDYAFRWSLGIGETITLLAPNAYGGSSSQTFEEDSKFVEKLIEQNIPEGSAIQQAGSLPKYWGGMSSMSEGTSGPPYLGTITCLLFIIGLVVVKSHHRWWILAATVMGIFMSWGRFFPAFNNLLFDALPLYNKFRAPSMSLVITQFAVPILAMLCVQTIFFTEKGREYINTHFKHLLYALGGLVVLLGLVYLMNDFKAPIDAELVDAFKAQQGGAEVGPMIVKAMKADRQAMIGSAVLRVIAFSLLLLGVLYLYNKKMLSPVVAVLIIALANTIDLLSVDNKYLNASNYIEKDGYTDYNFAPSEVDNFVLKDSDPHFRVYNLAPDRFSESKTSYYHRSIGGYHPAKLRIYQDVIENQLSKNPPNMGILNMLDVRYFLIPPQQANAPANVQRNDSAMGAAWFVKELRPANGPADEMKALDSFNPRQTATIDTKSQQMPPQPQWDSAATITLSKYNNDTIIYSANTATNQFAVFSEVYYPAGWNAYVDGKKADYYKVNYFLRGMPVPAGKHEIKFIFEPQVYKTSYNVALASVIIMYLLLIGGLAMHFYTKRKKLNPA